MTFAIAARCADTGRIGVAISTRALGVTARCPFIVPGVGVVVTMARTDPRLGPLGINLLKLGYSARRALEEISTSDPNVEWRQLCVIDRDGNAVARTGSLNKVWSGAVTEKNLVAMGNNLKSEKTAGDMAKAWRAGTKLEFAERLMTALEAGRDAGGQNGGQNSAGLVIYDREIYPYYDLRVDAHDEPVGELRRVYQLYQPLADYYYGRPGAPEAFGREEEWLAKQGKKSPIIDK
ncbi:MAG: hypothetical protein JWN94_2186 [Betaproteobacteria bacterium]|nr:hypothetical protein [Betaproteobacteria bacterium]